MLRAFVISVLVIAMANCVIPAVAACDHHVVAGGRVPREAGQTRSSSWTVLEFRVAGEGRVLNKVTLNLDMVHSWVEDLEIQLIAPDGTTVTLFDRLPGRLPRFDDFDDTVFDDDAPTRIEDGAPPYRGRYKPQNPLSAFRGINPNGVWQLRIWDHYHGDYGYVYRAGDPRFEQNAPAMGWRERLSGTILRLDTSAVCCPMPQPGLSGPAPVHTVPHGEGLRGLSPAIRAATDIIKWHLVIPRGIAHGGITFSDYGQFLYFKTWGANHQGQVFKVCAADGSIVWATDPNVIGFGNFSYTGVTVDEINGRVFTGGRSSSQPAGAAIIAALNISTGDPIWVKKAHELGLAGGDFGRGNVLLSTDRTRVYVRDNGNPDRIVCLNSANGNHIWTFVCPFPSGVPFQTAGPIWRDPVTGRDRIAMVNNQVTGSVLLIEDTGVVPAIVWTKDIAVGLNYRWWGNAVASLDFQTLYLNSFQDAGNPVFTALNSSTGDILWQIWPNVNTNGMNQYQNPAVGGDGTIYSGGRVVAPPPIMVGPAAVGNANDYWNSIAAKNSIPRPWTLENLRTGGDTATTIDIAVVDFAESSTYPPSDGDRLMRDYHYLGAHGYNGPAAINLSQVPPGTYDLYLYSFTPIANDQNAVFTVGAQTKTVFPAPAGPFGGYMEDENYVVFRGISPDGNGNIRIQVDIDFLNTYAVVNGLQLHGRTGSLANQYVNLDLNQLGNIGGGITAIRPDGSIKWQFKPEGSGEFSGWPTVTCGRVIYAADQVTFDNTRLYAVRDNGPDASLLWTFTLAYNYFGNVSPAVGPDGTVYVCAVRDNADNQILYAFAPLEDGDANGDGCVDDQDLLLVLFAFGNPGGSEDLNGDGIVDDSDLLLVLFNLGSGC